MAWVYRSRVTDHRCCRLHGLIVWVGPVAGWASVSIGCKRGLAVVGWDDKVIGPRFVGCRRGPLYVGAGLVAGWASGEWTGSGLRVEYDPDPDPMDLVFFI